MYNRIIYILYSSVYIHHFAGMNQLLWYYADLEKKACQVFFLFSPHLGSIILRELLSINVICHLTSRIANSSSSSSVLCSLSFGNVLSQHVGQTKILTILTILIILMLAGGEVQQPKWDNRPTVVGRTQKQQGSQMRMTRMMKSNSDDTLTSLHTREKIGSRSRSTTALPTGNSQSKFLPTRTYELLFISITKISMIITFITIVVLRQLQSCSDGGGLIIRYLTIEGFI